MPTTEADGGMPSEYLWTGKARELYDVMTREGGYSKYSNSAIASLVQGYKFDRVMLIGAGPNPREEIRVLDSLMMSPSQIVVHDCVKDTKLRDIFHEAGYPNMVGLAMPFNGLQMFTGIDLLTFIGYSLGNLTDQMAMGFLCALRKMGERLLLNVPVASHFDPRKRGHAFINAETVETSWYTQAYTQWKGTPPQHVESRVHNHVDGYTVVIYGDGNEIIRFRRRSVSGWIAQFEMAGWNLEKAHVAQGDVSRLSVLLY